jgi:hypothetical protein
VVGRKVAGHTQPLPYNTAGPAHARPSSGSFRSCVCPVQALEPFQHAESKDTENHRRRHSVLWETTTHMSGGLLDLGLIEACCAGCL